MEGDKLICESRALFTTATRLLLSILGDILRMSNDTRIALSVILLAFIVSNMSIRLYESFIIVAMFSVNFAHCFSTNIARFSMTLLHPVTKMAKYYVTIMFGLCVL